MVSGLLVSIVSLSILGWSDAVSSTPLQTMSVSQPNLSTSSTSVTHHSTLKPTHASRVNKSVCFQHVGCFNNSPPFNYANLDLPKSPEAIGTQFLLYTRQGPLNNNTMFISYINETILKESLFNPKLPTKFIIHGFTNTIKTEWLYAMKDELLKKGDFNVIIVVWGPGAALPDYNQAVANTRVVGTQTKMVLDMLVKFGANDKDMHLIGHSLGAHTSGYVGRLMRQENRILGRISGLDPAEPDYEFHDEAVRLDKSDAAFVDVIHSAGDKFANGGPGLMQKSGHIDFYLNGGVKQPDCPNPISGALSHIGDLFTGHFNSFSTMIACSHSRSHEVFAESINTDCPFTAYPCQSYAKFQRGDCLSCGTTGCAQMGYHSDYYTYTEGKMYLNTKFKAPFCGYHYGVHVNISPSAKNTKGDITLKLHGMWAESEWLQVTKKKDDALHQGGRLGRVLLSNQEVGKICDITVKYVKSEGGFLFGSGSTGSLRTDKVLVESGETGKSYLFCTNQPLKTKVGTNFTRAANETC